ncbi:MAG: hypothetical protein Q4G03_01450 [Planctomycetia bacterium]|nr:hypothetical protein [Planctomycetia bacterium]
MTSTRAKESWYDQCIELQQNGELGQAVTELKALIAEYPDYALAHLALAVFSLDKGQEVEALQQMEIACELEEEDPFYFTAFSALAIKCGSHDQAEMALMRAQEARFAAQMKKLDAMREKARAERMEHELREQEDAPQDDHDDSPEQVEENLRKMNQARREELAQRDDLPNE